MQTPRVSSFAICLLAATVAATSAFAQTSASSDNAQLLSNALRDSVLIHGHQPFHLVVKIGPDETVRAHARAVPAAMRGTLEIFWAASEQYKLVLDSPSFRQTKIVEGKKVEEHDEGDFYPRWLDNFVEALLKPVPEVQLPKLMTNRLMGGGSFVLPGRPAITMPRCAETTDRPGGITEETSVARVCFDASHDWYQGTLDFTRYVSFEDFEKFGQQMIPRRWLNDIPENIFVEGKVTVLEKLSAAELKTIRVLHATGPEEQVGTVFLSRKEIGDRAAVVPDYEWPPEDTEALEGYMIVYVRTDHTGQIRESYWDSSDNYKLQDAGVALALKSRLQPMIVDGAAVQMEGPLVLHFKTHRSSTAISAR